MLKSLSPYDWSGNYVSDLNVLNIIYPEPIERWVPPPLSPSRNDGNLSPSATPFIPSWTKKHAFMKHKAMSPVKKYRININPIDFNIRYRINQVTFVGQENFVDSFEGIFTENDMNLTGVHYPTLGISEFHLINTVEQAIAKGKITSNGWKKDSVYSFSGLFYFPDPRFVDQQYCNVVRICDFVRV